MLTNNKYPFVIPLLGVAVLNSLDIYTYAKFK